MSIQVRRNRDVVVVRSCRFSISSANDRVGFERERRVGRFGFEIVQCRVDRRDASVSEGHVACEDERPSGLQDSRRFSQEQGGVDPCNNECPFDELSPQSQKRVKEEIARTMDRCEARHQVDAAVRDTR